MIAVGVLVSRVQRGWTSGSILEAFGGRTVILPAIELQPGVQAVGKQGTQVATGTGGDTFSAAFGQSLRDTAQVQQSPAGTEVNSKTTAEADGKAASGLGGNGQVANALAAEISGRVAEATAQAAKQSMNQAAAGTLAAAKTSATSGNAAAANVGDVAKSSADAASRTVEEIDPKALEAVVAGTAGESVNAESGGKSNLVKAVNGDEELVAAGSETAKSDVAAAGVAAASARAAAPLNGASNVVAGEAKAAAGASAGKVAAAPVTILAGAAKPDAATLFALNSEPAKTALNVNAGSASATTAAAALKDTDAVASAGTAPTGKGVAGLAATIQDEEQTQVPAGASKAASATPVALAGAVQVKVPVTAKASTGVAATSSAKVQGAKSGVSGAGAAVASGKGITLQTGTLRASAAELAANTGVSVIPQGGTAVPTQTAALELPVALPSTATGAANAANIILARTEPAQGNASAIKAVSDLRTANKATGTTEVPETDAKSGLAKAASPGSSNGVGTTPLAVHASTTQVGTASVQAIAAAHVLPVAVSTNSGSGAKTSVQSAVNSAQAAPARPVAAASVQAPAATEDKAVTAAAVAGTAEKPVVEAARTGDSNQAATGVATGQGVTRAGGTLAANLASASTSTPAASTSATTASSPSFVEVAATAGVHAASAPAGAVTAANGAIASTTGVIAAGHPASVAGVAAGAGGGATAAAGTVSSALSGVGGAARSDLATAVEPHRTLVATPNTLEVGVPDGTQGWLRIRAEVGDQGQVNASLAAASGASQEMLHRELPALNAYLHSEQMSVTATVSDRSFTGAGGGQAGITDDSGRALAGGTGGGMTQGGASGGQQSDAGRQGIAASSVQSYSGTAGLSDATIANSTGVGYDGESGRWLNVRA